jgi:hypothetical protein
VSTTLFFPHLPEDTRLWQDDCPACLVETGQSVHASVLNNGYRACSNCFRVCLPQPIRYNFMGAQKWLSLQLRKAAALFLTEPLRSPGHGEYTQYWPTAVVESNLDGLLINHGSFKTYLTRGSNLDQQVPPTSLVAALGSSRQIPEALSRLVSKLHNFRQLSTTNEDRLCFVGTHEMFGVAAWISLVGT